MVTLDTVCHVAPDTHVKHRHLIGEPPADRS